MSIGEILTTLREGNDYEECECIASLLNAFIKCRKRASGSETLTADDLIRFGQVVELNMGIPQSTPQSYAPKTAQRGPLMSPNTNASTLARTTANLRNATAAAPQPPLNAHQGPELPADMMHALEQSLQPRAASG